MNYWPTILALAVALSLSSNAAAYGRNTIGVFASSSAAGRSQVVSSRGDGVRTAGNAGPFGSWQSETYAVCASSDGFLNFADCAADTT